MARFRGSEFSTLKLERADEKKFTEWVTKENPQPFSAITEMLGQGYKVSCSFVTDQNAFCFSIVGTDNSKINRNAVMTTWSDDLEEVILMAAYKHFVMCDGNEWPTRGEEQRWG